MFLLVHVAAVCLTLTLFRLGAQIRFLASKAFEVVESKHQFDDAIRSHDAFQASNKTVVDSWIPSLTNTPQVCIDCSTYAILCSHVAPNIRDQVIASDKQGDSTSSFDALGIAASLSETPNVNQIEELQKIARLLHSAYLVCR